MKTIKERVQFAHAGSLVVRFHQHIGHRLNTDGQHSWGVATLCLFLSDGLPSNKLLLAALTHDLAEQVMGDVPFPVKRSIPGLKKTLDDAERDWLRRYDLDFPLTEAERSILTLADSLDGILYCASEAALGNRTLHPVYVKWLAVVETALVTLTQREVINAVIEIYKESCNGQAYEVGT